MTKQQKINAIREAAIPLSRAIKQFAYDDEFDLVFELYFDWLPKIFRQVWKIGDDVDFQI